MSSTQRPRYVNPVYWDNVFWRLLTSPACGFWLLAVAALAFLLMSLVPQIPLAALRNPALASLWLEGIKSPWTTTLPYLHNLGLTHLIHSRLSYIYLALVAAVSVLQLLRVFHPRWTQPYGKYSTEQWRLPLSIGETLTHLDRSLAFVGLRTLQKPLARPSTTDTSYIQGISRGIRRWGSALLVLGLGLLLVTGIFTGWNDPPSDPILISSGEVFPLPGKPNTVLRLNQLNLLENQDRQITKVVSHWEVTSNNLVSQIELSQGQPAQIGETYLYLLGYGPAVRVTASDSDGHVLRLQRVLGDLSPQETLRLRFDRDQQEQLVTQQDSGILLRLIYYPSLPAQGIPGRALHVQVLRSDTGELIQQAYLDKSGTLSVAGLNLDFSMEYYVMVRAQDEPWLWLVFPGVCLVVAGLILVLFMPNRELWLAITPTTNGTWCQVWARTGVEQAPWMHAWRAMMREVADVQC
jgi:hypothetical protein